MLLLDEPLSGVDRRSAARIEAVFARAARRGPRAARRDPRRRARPPVRPRAVPAPPPGRLRRARRGADHGGAAGDLRRRARAPRRRCGARPSSISHSRHEHGDARPRALLEPFGHVTQRALVEVLVLRLACGPLGVWILLCRQSYAAESMSHAMLPGLVLAALAGVPLVLGAAGGLLAAAALIALAGRDERIGGDLGVAVAITALIGLGALLALSPETPPRLQELLFGDLLGVEPRRPRRRPGRAGGADRCGAGARASAARASPRSTASAARSLGARAGALGAAPARAARRRDDRRRARAGQPAAGRADPRARAPRCGSPAACPPTLALAPRLAALAGVAGLVLSFHLGIAAGASVALCAAALAGGAPSCDALTAARCPSSVQAG